MTRIGVLGFDEAGSTFAGALADAGAVVDSYDKITWLSLAFCLLLREQNARLDPRHSSRARCKT
jgi:hypothetical protein